MKPFYFACLTIFIQQVVCPICFSQAPGNITNSLKLWLKSDSGVVVSGNYVSQWTNQVFNPNISVQASKSPNNHVILLQNKFNYNPGLVYDGTIKEELRGIGKATDWTDEITAYSVANCYGSTFLNQYFLTSIFVSDKKGISLYENYYYADGHGASKNFAANTISGTFKGTQLISVNYKTNSTYNSSIYRNGALIETYTGSAISAPVTDTFEIGGRMAFGWHTRIFKGNIGEVIVYKGSHTQLQRQKIQSYLAIKHGLTLNRSSSPEYFNSLGNGIFTDATGKYWHDIIGIGRDDSSALLQKQSRQSDNKTHIFIGSIKSSNKANNGTFGSNNQYVIIGNNRDSLNSNATSSEFPIGKNIVRRIRREWKIVNTNFSGKFSLRVDTDFANGVNLADLCILVDDDGRFANASIHRPTFALVNGYLEISNISTAMVAKNISRFITIAQIQNAPTKPFQDLYVSNK